jgi:hypothetical protein
MTAGKSALKRFDDDPAKLFRAPQIRLLGGGPALVGDVREREGLSGKKEAGG